jgi:hypothetical protein
MVYTLSKETLPLIDSFYERVCTAGQKYPFCLLIEPDNYHWNDVSHLEKIIETIISVTFHYHYLKLKFNAPVLLFRGAETDIGRYISQCREALLCQGYDEIECILLDGGHALSWPEKGKKGICFHLQTDHRHQIPSYTESILAIASLDHSFFFELKALSGLSDILEALRVAEQNISDQHPSLCHLLKEGRMLINRQQELDLQLGLLREQLDSKNSYHSSAHPATAYLTNQIKAITKFYKYEYEILPLWYKRLGHILKVLMGKRTFKSLFDDNAKKYKI